MLLRRSKSKDFENNTWKTYRYFLFRFLKWINKSLSDIDVNDILSYEAYLKSEKSYLPNSLVLNAVVLKKYAKCLRKRYTNWSDIYDFYVDESLPPKEDSEEIRRQKAKDLPTDLEVERLIQSAKCIRDKAIILCLSHVGLRVSEAYEMNWNDVDFNNKLLWVRTKGRNGRKNSVRIDNQTLNALNDLYNHQNNGDNRSHNESNNNNNSGVHNQIYTKYNNVDENYSSKDKVIFIGQQGRLKTHGTERIVKLTAKRAGITKNIYPHILRNYCLTKCALLSSEALARRQARHKATNMTQHYIILTDEMYWREYDKVWNK